jgi:uncharacterized protein
MSSRNFKQRYATTTGNSEAPMPHASSKSEWPLLHGARQADTPAGPCVIHDHVLAGEAIVDCQNMFMQCMHLHGTRYHDPADLLFLDTETTGLAGGTGTHVFLVGVGRFTGDALHVRQFFMRHPGDERGMLRALDADLRHAAALVTYNGKAFDVPLLETRFRMHGWTFDGPEQHIDLLSAARAIWKHRLPNCSLGTIERIVLGVTRDLDAPGWMIPQLYFDYLRSRNIGLLEPVFAHNRSDIASLARITALVHAFEARIDSPANQIDRLAVALHCLRRFSSDAALDDLKALWSILSIPADLRLRAFREMSTTLKRQRRYAEAVAEWQRGLSDPSRPIRLFAFEELAKYLEHRARDHAGAHALARRGADGALLARDARTIARQSRRAQRLERKLLRHGNAASTDLTGEGT